MARVAFPVLLLAALLLFVACTPVPRVTIAPEAPVAEPTPAPPSQETAPAETFPAGPEPFAQANGTTVTFDGPIRSVRCDRATRTLVFTVKNPTDYTWNLDKQLPFPSPKGYSIVSFSLNGVDMNSGQKRTFDGETLFGDLPFSSHCDSGVELNSGATATCTVSPVPLKQDKGVDAQTNEISMNAQGLFKVETFLC